MSALPGLGLESLKAALQEKPHLTIRFFSYGIVISKKLADGTFTEYPVSADAIGNAMAANLTFDTGLLPAETLCVRMLGTTHIVCEYRRPQKTAIWLDGADDPLRIPLPGLLLIRTTRAGTAPTYRLFAVKERPQTYDVPLYHPPLPNTGTTSICWGTVRRVNQAALSRSSLSEDWAQLLGTRFGNHSVGGKSKKYRDDVRKMYTELHERRARVWPRHDLMEVRQTLTQALEVTQR